MPFPAPPSTILYSALAKQQKINGFSNLPDYPVPIFSGFV